jgi:hypothetical protein
MKKTKLPESEFEEVARTVKCRHCKKTTMFFCDAKLVSKMLRQDEGKVLWKDDDGVYQCLKCQHTVHQDPNAADCKCKECKRIEAEWDKYIVAKLRYMKFDNVLKDFKTPDQIKAIRAVFKWLSLSGICAWKNKKGLYYCSVKRLTFGLEPAAIVLDYKEFNEASDKVKTKFKKVSK